VIDRLSLSTDQVAAFVELARSGSLRLAAEALIISEQGLRSRLLALEKRIGAELYHKARGIRRGSPLTPAGRRFLPYAEAFLERAAELTELFSDNPLDRQVHVAASQYLVLYVLVDVLRRFHAANPQIHINISVKSEQEIEEALREDPDVVLGIAAPHEPSPDLEYIHLFSLDWKLITPARHPLLQKKRVRLVDLTDQPLILFERGSTGRQHVIDGFHLQGVTPRVETETTNTEIIVRMVEAGFGVSIVPLLPNGLVTKGRRVGICELGDQIRPIHSGILFRKGATLPAAVRDFVAFVTRELLQKEIGG
jgi:DNA-binding transcriptional LysR family regulator